MSRMKIDGKPPLAKSPIRVRPSRSLRSNSSSMETPFGPSRYWDKEEEQEQQKPELPQEYQSISCELLELAKMVKQEFCNKDAQKIGFLNNPDENSNSTTSPLFERGRFYEIYSARRNERLKRKKIEGNLGVHVEALKRGDSKKLFESARKSMASVYSSVDRSEQTRYSLRSGSCKENKKPPLAVKFDKSAVVQGGRKIGSRRVSRV